MAKAGKTVQGERAKPDDAAAVAARVQVKKKDLIERVALKGGVKKAAARDLTDAVLAVMAEALEAGETLVVPPLGKLSLARRTERAGSAVLHLRLKRAGAQEGEKKDEKSGSDPLAKPEE
ncbi:HU family DNA-binding protein [Rhodobacter lacus]|uniref:HU family DNA-binding protein n=1 Tax=Rhodobacter lacus TaxID=1641972 RepID=A0ABW5A2V0_9RHOB